MLYLIYMALIERQESIPEQHELRKKYSPHLAQLLYNRNILSVSDAEDFLNPQFEKNYDPFLMKDMLLAVERLYRAIQNKESIVIYADYDADGIPAAIILSSLFKKIHYPHYEIYIPHRYDEGYGIHQEALEKITSEKKPLIISVDVGITAHEAADWCTNNDIDLIITDHHLPETKDGKEFLPKAFAVVNPKREECFYPDPMLAGSGVAFKLVQAFLIRYGKEFHISKGWEKWLLDMVGIATISDMVPLLNENRIFAYFGLKVIQKTKRKGLKSLIWKSGASLNHLNEEDVSFGIAPKINAASRMGKPEDALAVFLAESDVDAESSVKHLEDLNKKRKLLVAQTSKQAYAKVEKKELKDIIVVGSPDWQAGILGLIASKLVEKYQKPAFVWSLENGVVKGSCRSYNGFNLVEIMERAPKETFIQFGGHKEAGGFSCDKNEVHFLEERLLKNFPTKEIPDEESFIYDDVIELSEINESLYQEIQKLGPFGASNEKPLFLFKGIIPTSVKQFGKGSEHFELSFKNGNTTLRAISFFREKEDFSFVPEPGIGGVILGHIEQSYFMGKKELRIRIVDYLEKG